jgi:hypothetical protein
MISQFSTRRIAFTVILLAVAALFMRFALASLMSDLPADYTNETFFDAESRFRDSPDGSWQTISLIARRMDQTLVNTGSLSVIQGDMHWFSDDGQVIFENTGLYGVDRRTRLNVPAYGDTRRNGSFLFPPHIGRADFTFWDPMFIGLRTAVFERSETLDGLSLYVFHFSGTGMDETEGYSYLHDVPELYRTLTDGEGTLWIEPVSGILVDYEEQGISYFVDASSGTRMANFYEWSDRFTPKTKASQMKMARAWRLRILALEIAAPGGLALISLFFALVFYRRMATNRAKA